MRNLGILDIPYLLNSRGSSINDATLVGLLVGEVEPPPHFKGIGLRDKNDRYAVVDLVGIKTNTNEYYAKGRFLTVVDKNLLKIAKAKDSGRLAVSLTNGSIRINNRGGVVNFVSMAKWSKGQYNSWQVGKVEATGFRKDDYPEFFDLISKAYKNNWNFEYPVSTPSSYTESCEGFEFTFIDPTHTSSNNNTKVNTQTTSDSDKNQPEKGITVKLPTNQPKETQASPSLFDGAPSVLGTSSGSNMGTLVDNMASTHAEVKNRSKFKIENRDKLAPKTKNIKLLEDTIKASEVKVKEIIETLPKFEEADDAESNAFTDEMAYTAEKLKTAWHHKIGGYTGFMLFKESLERVLPDYANKDANNQSVISTTLTAMGERAVDEWINPSEEFRDNKLLLAVSENKQKVYISIIETLVGTWGKLISSAESASYEGVDFLAILKENPYNLCFINPRMDIEELDRLAMAYGTDLNDPAVKVSRNVAYMHNYMLDSTNNIIGDNTVVTYSELMRNVTSGYILSKRNHNVLLVEGAVMKRDKIESFKYFINPETLEDNFKLPLTGWRPKGAKFYLQNGQDAHTMVADFLNSGLGVLVEIDGINYVSDYVFAAKEIYVYNRLRELSESGQETDITDESIEKCIKDFEKLKAKEFGLKEGEFKLEHRQAQAVSLLKNPVMCLTGPAGSGKTTTAEALVYGAETLLNVNPDEILFCAPTGKAANRLKEVVKRKTRTINSLFGIGGEGLTVRDPKNVRKKEGISVLIVDETSMPNINLMYEMMMRIEDDTRIYFLGDIEQLPPIGFGKPYANMLMFLPTIVLNVTKRASDSSYITKNAKKIIYESDGVIADLENGADFRIIQEKNPEVLVNNVINVCRYHLGKGDALGYTPLEVFDKPLNPDDIQVISPINKNNWGTLALNNILQDIFNPKRPNETYVSYARSPQEKMEFRKGDRVIHTKSNQPERTRLIQVDGPQFRNESTKGINNGDVGKIVGFYKATALDFSGVLDKALEEELKLEFKGTDNVVFMAVQYKDVDEDTGESITFVILYRMDIINKSGYHLDVISHDLKNLDLAYALTVHKLQGSEAKLVIVLMLSVGRDGFISRNMVYTAITRGKKGCYMIGDILGKGSCVNKARKVEQTAKRLTNIDNM